VIGRENKENEESSGCEKGLRPPRQLYDGLKNSPREGNDRFPHERVSRENRDE